MDILLEKILSFSQQYLPGLKFGKHEGGDIQTLTLTLSISIIILLAFISKAIHQSQDTASESIKEVIQKKLSKIIEEQSTNTNTIEQLIKFSS
mgnify:CR=1 FL=1